MNFGILEISNPGFFFTGVITLVIIFIFLIYIFFLHRKRKTVYEEIYKKFISIGFIITFLSSLFLYLFSFMCLIILFLGVKIHLENPEISHKDKDIVFIVDASFSMYARDMTNTKTRFEYAKDLIRNTVQNTSNNEIGVYIFSKNSYNYIPQNPDKKNTVAMLDQLDIEKIQKNNKWISGTSTGDSILHAGNDANQMSVLVIVADGGITDGVSVKQALSLVGKKFTDIYYVSIGSDKESYAYVPTGNFGVGQNVLIDGRDDSLKDVLGKNFFVFQNDSFIKQFIYKIQNNHYPKHISTSKILVNKSTLYFTIAIIFCVLLFLTLIEKFRGDFKKIYIILLLINISGNIYLSQESMDKTLETFYITNEVSVQKLKSHINTLENKKTDMAIGFYDKNGKPKIAYPLGVNKEIVLQQLQNIPKSDKIETSSYIGIPQEKKAATLVISVLMIVCFIYFIKRYIGKS